MDTILILTIILTCTGLLLTGVDIRKKFKWHKVLGVVILISGTALSAIDGNISSRKLQLETKNIKDTNSAHFQLTKQIDKKIDEVINDTVLRVRHEIRLDDLKSDRFVSFYIQVLEKARITENEEKQVLYSNLIKQYLNDKQPNSIEKNEPLLLFQVDDSFL